MNKTYKVIYNRTRCMYQVVSELAKGHTKSETPEMLKSLFSKHSGLTRGIVMAVLSMSLAMPVGVAVQAADTAGTDETTTNTDNTTVTETAANTDLSNLTDAGRKVITDAASTTVTSSIGTLSKDGNYIKAADSVSTNLSTLDTQVKTNADAVTKEVNDRTSAISSLTSDTTNKLAAKANVDASNIGNNLKQDDGAKALDDDITKNLIAWGKALGAGSISSGNSELVTGGTLYSELRLSTDGTYVKIANTTANNLIALDTNLKNVIDAIGLDADDTTTSYTSKLNKYFKVNPEVMTNTDNTKTYAPDAAANGTNSVAIGPSAQAGEKTTDATTSTATVTGGTSSTAIGDSAVANGNTSVALGANAKVLNTTDQDGKTTATITGSTAIGSGAKVNGATDATAIGTSAQVNETATGGIAFGKNAATGEDEGTVTVGDVTANVAAVGGENSVALGTDAKASGNTALALGKGAQVNNYTTQSGTTVTKTVNSGSTAIGSSAVVTGANDAVALGTGASVTGTGDNADDSMAIGKGASVATAKDAMALGTSAAVASGATNAVAIGNTAKANTSNTTAIGYNASAIGAGAVAIGENTSTSTEGGISIGSGTSVSGKSIVIGYATDANGNTVKTESQNTDAVAIGNGAQANANDSISIGHQAGKDTSEGRTSGYGSLIAIGTNAGNNVKGMQNVALGSGAGSNVKSSYNVAIGSNAGAGINYAASADTNPQNGYNISIGYEANYQSADANAKNIAESIAIGHSANAVSNATAMGYKTTASGDKSMALGYSATAADTDSIALGDNASAAGGNIAIGSGSQAPAVTTYESSYLTNNTTVNGYISLGGTTSATTGTTVLRRISNVADGSADQDAVTVAQLKAAYMNLEGTIKTTDTKISDTYTQSAIDSKISTVESKITASQTKYFSINPSSDTLTANENNDGASTTGAADAMAIGPNATATSAKAVAIGNNVSASGKGSIALGTADNPATTGTVDAGNNTSANPHVTSAEGANSVAIGTSAIAQTDNSVALGTRASVYTSNVTDTTTGTTTKVGQQSIAIGYEAETRNSNATSIGSGAKAYSDGSTAIGHSAYAQGADSVVLGTSSTANGASSGIVGKSNTINGSNTYAVGSENNVNGNWGAVTYSGLYGSKNIVNPVSDTSGNTKHGMDSLSITGNSNTISQGSYSDTVQNISILGNSNSVTGANTDEANAGTTANITVIGGSNTVTGRDGAGSDDMGKTWNQLTRTTVIGYGNIVNQATSTTSLADTQILGNDVTATLGNSVYLGTGAAAKTANLADATTLTDAEQAAVDALDTTGMTDTEKATAQAQAKAAARYATNLAAMKKSGTTAGLQSLSTDTAYDDGTSYTYAGSSPAGVVTVGSVGSERRIQNVAAGLVSASSTDAVNGSQLYALTRQLRFGGDNSIIGDTTDGDTEVVKRGSGEALSIIGGAGVTTATVDGKTTVTVDSTKLTDNNIGVIADSTNNSLSVKLASDLKKLNTASLGSGSGDSYKETIKLDGTDGKVTVADSSGTVKTTLDTTGLTIANGPKFTSSGIDAASQQIKNVTAGTADTDAANVGQVKTAAAEATTEVKAGTNASLGTVATSAADKHKIYTVNVDNLAVKANGTGTTTVELAKGINFKDGTNTTATVGTDGTVTISATHNKLSTASAAPTGTKDDATLTLTDADGNTVTSTGLKNTYTTVTKDGTAHTVTFARNDGTTQTLSLGDLDGASKGELATAAAKATSEVTNGTNVTSVTKTAGTNGQNIYTVNVDDLAVKTTSGEKKSVHLADGLVFADGTNTTATVGDNGTIKYNVSNDAIKAQAKDAVVVAAGDNVSIDTPTDANNVKTYTVKVNDLKLQANGEDKGTRKLAEGINFANGKNTTATVENGKVIYRLNDALTDLTSVTARDTEGNQTLVSGSGVTITPAAAGAQSISLTTNGLSMGNQQITNVQSGGDTDTNAANISDVKRLVQASASGTAETGFNVKGDDADAKKVKLGKQLNVVGGTTDSTKLSDNNIGVVTTADADGNATLTVKLNKAIALDSVTAGSSVLSDSGLTITDGPKFTKNGIDAGSQKITGVANGENDNDAVNKGQLDALQTQVSGGWSLVGNNAEGNAVTAKIGAGKTVTYGDGNYTKSVVTKDDSTGNATVKVDVTTGTFGSGTGDKAGTVTATANGLATTQDVVNAINSASISVVADNTPENKTAVKAGDTIHFAKDGNLTLTQNGATFTYGLNKEINISKVTTSDTTKGSTVQTVEGITTKDAAGNTYEQTANGITLTPKTPGTGKTAVSLTNTGLNNGNNVISGVGAGSADTDAVNVSQLKKVQDQVGSGWQIAGNDGTKVADIGAGKKVAFKSSSKYLTTSTARSATGETDTGADVTYSLKTKELASGTNGAVASVSDADDGLVTAKNVAETINKTYWTAASGKSGSGSQTDETANAADKQISAGDTVTFNAGNNLSLIQNGASFTYGLQADLTGMDTITFTPRNDPEGHPFSLVIGKQKDGLGTDEGYYITGLDNTTWNQSNYVKNRAATEAQLADAIKQVTLASQSGGFKLSDDNNKEVSQVLGQAIGVVGDSNITTVAETTTTDTNGHIKVSLNKNIDLGADGSLQAGGVTLQNNSVTVGTNGVVISSSGTDRTVSNLSNIHWDTAKANQEASAGGYIGSTKAATESQLAEAITTATNTVSANEQHIRNGSYSVQTIDNEDGTKSQGVSIDIITGDGTKPEDVKGKVVIKDVAKASDVGDVSELHDTLKNADGKKNVTGALNNLDDRVTGLDNRMDKIYTTAGQHSSVSAENNIQVDSQSKNGTGGTDYKLSLNKEKIDLKNVTIEGNAGAVTAKTVTAEKYNVGDKTYISSDGINANSQKITNVQTGTADTDAANVGQMREADAQLADAIQQTDAGLNEVGRAVNKLGNRLNRVGAGAAALAALHPGTYDPNDKWDFSAGIGHYHDANAVAIGAYYHPNDTTILSIGGSMGGGENMVNAGITWKMGRSGREQAAQPVVVRKVQAAPVVQQVAPVRTAPVVTPAPVTTPAPVKSVAPATPVQAVPAVTTPMTPVTPSNDTAALAQILARQTAILEKLAQNQSQAAPSAAVAHGDDIFPDVPDNHWAYAYVAKLEKAGALNGFKRPAVLKSPMMTRDDFASVLYTAMANGATTNPSLNGDDSLNRLAQEFKAELKNVKV